MAPRISTVHPQAPRKTVDFHPHLIKLTDVAALTTSPEAEQAWRNLSNFELWLRTVYLYRRMRVQDMKSALSERRHDQLRRLEAAVNEGNAVSISTPRRFRCGMPSTLQIPGSPDANVQLTELSAYGAKVTGAPRTLGDNLVTLICPLRVFDDYTLHFPARVVLSTGAVQGLIFSGAPYRSDIE